MHVLRRCLTFPANIWTEHAKARWTSSAGFDKVSGNTFRKPGADTMPYSHLATATNILWKLLESYEHNPGEVFLAAGIEPDLLKQPGARIRYRAVNQAWQRATELIEDDCFGLQGPKFWHPSYLYGLGYAWLASHSLRESLQRFVRYLDIVSEGKGISLEEDLAGFRICFDFKSEGLRVSAQMDCLIAVIYHMCRLNFGEELQPLSVSFQHPPPGCADQYQRYFQAPVRFSAPGDCILFPLDAVEKTLPGTNPQFARMHDQLNVDYLARLREGSLVHRVKAGIIEALPSGPVANEKVARDLGMSVRSLQRRLAEAGTSFRDLLDASRQEMALNYIRETEIELAEIAFLLGFSDQSAFSRAFKRWTGNTPNEVRKAHT